MLEGDSPAGETKRSGWVRPAPLRPVPGVPGFSFADVPNRAIAYAIDTVLLAIINLAVVASIGLGVVTVEPPGGGPPLPVAGPGRVVPAGYAVPAAAVAQPWISIGTGDRTGLAAMLIVTLTGAGYAWFTWTRMRGTLGMKALGMQLGTAGGGGTITTWQAARRWTAMGGPIGIVLAVSPPALAAVLALLAVGWFLYLLRTTSTSASKQGFHDRLARTMVVKATRFVD